LERANDRRENPSTRNEGGNMTALELMPIIEELAAARSHQARMEWLLACPISIMAKYSFTIRDRLAIAGFQEGVRYVDTIEVMRMATRGADGNFRAETWALHDAAVYAMQAAIEAADRHARTTAETLGGVTDL
jgi:hypothetical protein